LIERPKSVCSCVGWMLKASNPGVKGKRGANIFGRIKKTGCHLAE
jgi:hypothetical protein